jgi:hypothetical protein
MENELFDAEELRMRLENNGNHFSISKEICWVADRMFKGVPVSDSSTITYTKIMDALTFLWNKAYNRGRDHEWAIRNPQFTKAEKV